MRPAATRSLCLGAAALLIPLASPAQTDAGQASAEQVDQAAQAAFHRQFMNCQQTQGEIARLRCFDALAAPAAKAMPEDDASAPGGPPEPSEEQLAAEARKQREEQEQRETRVARLESLSRRDELGMLTADDPNYVVFAVPVEDDIGDENHAEFYVSLKYPLVDDWFEKGQNAFRTWDNAYGDFFNSVTPDRLLLHYNGLYDFYITDSDRYESAPIVSRRQNPGVSFEYDFARGRNTLRVGWFHESNGQTLEEDERLRFEARRALRGEDFALAEVSRGWDYATLRWASNTLLYEDPRKENWFNYQIETRFYCDCQGFGFIGEREDAIWWEEGSDVEISDFDGLRGMLERPLWRSGDGRTQVDARLALQTGLESSFGQYWTGRLTLGAEWDNLRLTLFYFDGYGRDPSTYHLRTQYAGLGIELR